MDNRQTLLVLGFAAITLAIPTSLRSETLADADAGRDDGSPGRVGEPSASNLEPAQQADPVPAPPTAAFPEDAPTQALPSADSSTGHSMGAFGTWSSQPVAVAGSAPAEPRVAQTPASHASAFTTPPARGDQEAGGLFGPIRLGPMLGVGVPNLLNFGALLKITDYFAAGVNVGLIPTVRLSLYGEARLKYEEVDAFVRLHPFAGGFFIGSGLGYATISGTVTDDFDTSAYANQIPAGVSIPSTLTYSSRGSVRTMVVTPQIGYFYTTQVGFSIGLDFGAQVPVAPSNVEFESQLPLPASTPQPLVQGVQTQLLDPTDVKVRDTLESIGRTPVPTLNLRIGWLL